MVVVMSRAYQVAQERTIRVLIVACLFFFCFLTERIVSCRLAPVDPVKAKQETQIRIMEKVASCTSSGSDRTPTDCSEAYARAVDAVEIGEE